MPSNDRLTEFAAVANARSISAAARSLGIERATLSRRMTSLEAELGVRLLHRSTSKLTLTPAGEELSRRAARIVQDAEEAWSAVRRMDDVPRGVLRVSMVGDMLDAMLIRYVLDFPEVRLELVDTSRPVGLIDERVDVAVRFGPVKDANLIARRVEAGVDRIVVGSPKYLERHGAPSAPKDLTDHQCLGPRQTTWPLRDGGRVPVSGRLGATESRLIRSAARAGVGLALLPVPLVHEDLASGALVEVLRDDVGDTVRVSIVFADREYIEPKVRVFVDRAVPALEAAYGAFA
ncbi:MAG: LysR family transcriptional regulator [Proteobacteria bacterium]|nr:LysR family transcriptional regulator [Pseudomonadota bacterium]